METKYNALDVAIASGLDVRVKGSRSWARCPLHGEKTASLCFFPDGKWKCFGCQAHGDAADLYAALHGVPLGEALRIVKGDGWHKRELTQAERAQALRNKVEGWKSERWAEEAQIYNLARRVRQVLEALSTTETLQESETFWDLLEMEADCLDRLNLLEAATPGQLVRMMGGIS